MSESKTKATDAAIIRLQQEAEMTQHSSALNSAAGFAHFWRIAKMFADSQFVPAHFRGKPGDCLIAIEMARDMKEHPLALMQQSYMVKGRPGWQSQFMIARANRNAGFTSRIRWRHETLSPPVLSVETQVARDRGSRTLERFKIPNLKVTAYCRDENGELIEACVTSSMAVGEDWVSNTKYQTMFENMMEWRAAAFLVRKYCPEVMMGMHTIEELETMPTEVFHDHVAEPTSKAEMLADRLAPLMPDVVEPGLEPETEPEAEPEDDDGPPWATISIKQVEELRSRGLKLKLDEKDLLEMFNAPGDVGKLEHLDAEDFEGYVEALDEFEAKR